MQGRQDYPNMLQALISSCNELSEGLMILDAQKGNFPIIEINDNFTTLTGYTQADVFKKNPIFLFGPGTNPNSLKKMRLCLYNKAAGSFNLLAYRKDGTTFWNRCSIMPIHYKFEGLKYFVCIIEDITTIIENVKTKSEVGAMVSVIHTMSDLVFNYMNYLQLFRMNIEDILQMEKSILTEFDINYITFLQKIKELNKLESYKELDIGDNFKLLDTETHQD